MVLSGLHRKEKKPGPWDWEMEVGCPSEAGPCLNCLEGVFLLSWGVFYRVSFSVLFCLVFLFLFLSCKWSGHLHTPTHAPFESTDYYRLLYGELGWNFAVPHAIGNDIGKERRNRKPHTANGSVWSITWYAYFCRELNCERRWHFGRRLHCKVEKGVEVGNG